MPGKSRAVLRIIEPKTEAICPGCHQRVKFKARDRLNNKQVIANVYVDGRWNRVEHYHAHCYRIIGQPYGEVA